jgi:hypothetical protein
MFLSNACIFISILASSAALYTAVVKIYRVEKLFHLDDMGARYKDTENINAA